MDLVTELVIFVLAAFVGFAVISKVPTTLHTPLMSQTNAIHGIVVLGGIIVLGYADDTLEKTIGFFFFLLFLFIRFLPMISIFEMRTLVPATGEEPPKKEQHKP